MDDSQTAWTSLIGYLLGAVYFFVMIGVPRSRGYTAKAMAWNRPQIAVRICCGSLIGCHASSTCSHCPGMLRLPTMVHCILSLVNLASVFVSMPSGPEGWDVKLGCAVLDEALAPMPSLHGSGHDGLNLSLAACHLRWQST